MGLFGNNSQKKRMRLLKATANEARDNGDWTTAAQQCKNYLDIRSDDAAIWVQYGHALKESLDLDGAEKAYQRSLDLAPDVADTHLMLGHLKKRRSIHRRALILFLDFILPRLWFRDGRISRRILNRDALLQRSSGVAFVRTPPRKTSS